MDNTKERLMEQINEYDARRGDMMRNATMFFGKRLRSMDNPVGRFFIANVSTKTMAHLIVRLGLFGVEKRPGMTLDEIALNLLKPSLFFNIPYELGEVSADSIEILRPECTVGFDEPGLCKVCRASMNMDMEIMRLLGGKLTVTETILEGAEKCRHIIEKA